ncbi:MAG TPA: alpha/beta hydrolase [Trebonia sp.]|jgi:pimeloyl-ACP methyl ester carboxylesterase|nr:alpha/beta hydrolase [Trebonia sp.]
MDISTFTAKRQRLAAKGGEIAYTEFGDGPRTALFIHGLGTSGALWRQVIEQVSDMARCVAIDLPGHGATPPREDLSVAALADVAAELADGLGLGQVDLVANDTGGAVAQVFAARQPERLRTLTLTNCDTDGNFPPPEFAPVIEIAKKGELAAMFVAVAGDSAAWRTSPLAAGYEHPENTSDEAWREYLTPVGGTIERARVFERILCSLDPKDLAAIDGALRALDVPTLIVWGTGDEAFGVEWAHRLRDTIPGAKAVIEVEGAKTFFPEERPDALVPHLRAHWVS